MTKLEHSYHSSVALVLIDLALNIPQFKIQSASQPIAQLSVADLGDLLKVDASPATAFEAMASDIFSSEEASGALACITRCGNGISIPLARSALSTARLTSERRFC